MQENQISHLFWTFVLLTEEDMASCSRAFRKSKSGAEERNLIKSAINFVQKYIYCVLNELKQP